MKTYKITHTTGTGRYDAGMPDEGYFFTVIGSKGATAAHNCPANRVLGQAGSCTLQDRAEIGKLEAVKIKSMINDGWTITNFVVEVDGLAGSWQSNENYWLGKEEEITLKLLFKSWYTL